MLTDIYVVFLSPSGQILVQYLKFGHNCSLPPFFNILLSIYLGLCSADMDSFIKQTANKFSFFVRVREKELLTY